MEKWARLESLVGEKSLEVLKNTKVLVLGLGGVGGYVVESLARSGIGSFILIDGDHIEKSNINRQIIALNSTIGLAKVDVFEKRIQDISEECIVQKKKVFITKDNIDLLFQEKVDYIVDACDTISVKKEIIRICTKRKIPFISCMGTGNKKDPLAFEIIDIRKTSVDPIARILRRMVKEEHIQGKVMVVSSREVPKNVCEGISSNSFVPAVAGLLCTSYIVNTILGKDHE